VRLEYEAGVSYPECRVPSSLPLPLPSQIYYPPSDHIQETASNILYQSIESLNFFLKLILSFESFIFSCTKNRIKYLKKEVFMTVYGFVELHLL
jgi:hypothetical protein